MKFSLKRAALLSATAIASITALPALAQEAPQADAADEPGTEIIVTATRRAISLQNAPINISAVTAESLKDQRVDDVRSLAAFTPGITIQDTGPRSTGAIVMRGLSANDTSAFGSNSDNTVGVYLGEIPLYQDFKFIDMNRVEVQLGPQGTLYGLGTLAGAIRYIPNRPDPDRWEGAFHVRVYDVAHAKDPGFVVDGMINVPLIPGKVAFRSATGYFNDPGFIDYNYLLKTPGVSDPQPNRPGTFFGSIGSADEIAQNFSTYEDANFEHTFTSRNQLGLYPFEGLALTLSYVRQQTDTNGRQANGGGVFGTGKYEAPWRYLEPSKRVTDLFAAEVEAELGDIAQLVSATAFTRQKFSGQTDVTDLLLDLDYDYELFPAFSGYTRSTGKNEQFNQEIRLVSTHGGPFSWVLGGFYNRLKTRSDYREIVPGYPAFAGINRPDEVEYASFVDTKTTEQAVFGELTFQPIDALTLTAGGRYFKYKAEVTGGTALPLFQTFPAINFRTRSGDTNDDGAVWKFNGSYKFTPDLMVYATFSKGYRIGGVNRVAPCVLPLNPGQNLCALPDELSFGPDTTRNKEIGIRASLFDGKLRTTLSVFHIDWSGIQLDGLTENGAIGITVNGGKAVSKGVEFSFNARPFDGFSVQGNWSYTDAYLTETVPGLLKTRTGEFDALPGDRLPGSTKVSGSIGMNYEFTVGEDTMTLSWTSTYTGDIFTRVGARAAGEVLPAYTTHRASVAYALDETLEFRVYADNIFDKFAVVSVSNDRSRRIVNDGVVSRYYSNAVLSPRKIGVEMTKKF
ncbi:MAG: TonB-dependent receptor [Novosphingobium sp. 17-62-19]|uniref:TonB-dependent receptor n=1 Tax=Novosphingobium sp. 17-62-19 TaxID=1970406 RepID=UPI000BC877C7|nr:TonB-dependent receptor [Novosphingobium sp. 17-62-19]OZA21263.1 MAG: TonB-dependent receptor [Novosphingobium sp. 17-62-19]HQS96542.1 TonB-dependent receptor [Novosphingobium sp.]